MNIHEYTTDGPLPILGMEVVVRKELPEFGSPEAVPDYEDRLAAMTAHHIDLSLLPLVTQQRIVLEADGKIFMHPNTLAEIKAAFFRKRVD